MDLQAKDLRIGNLVNQGPRYGDCCIEAYELYQYSMFIKNPIGVADYYKDWKPIPLTEEWLKRFGFKHNKELKYYFNDIMVIDEEFVMMDIDIKIEIKHVHQLQNLYFCLTGEELTIKD